MRKAVPGIFDFRGEKISHMRLYLDPSEALRAAGLAEAKD